MKLLTFTAFCSLAGLAAVTGCAAPDASDESVSGSSDELVSNTSGYTDVGPVAEHCASIGEGATEAGAFTDRNCGGMDGYEILVHQTADREMVSVRTKTGDFDLDLGAHFPNPGSLGPKAQWRGEFDSPGKVHPSALVLRYFQPTAERSNQSHLVVAKLTHDAVCVYAVLDGNQANSLIDARAEADKADTVTCPVVTPRPLAPTGCGVLQSGTGLASGAALASCEGRYSLAMQTDGNLVLYNNRKGRAIWQTKTPGSEGFAAFVRPTGEIALYGKTWNPLWSAATEGNPGATLNVQDDGNLVVYSAAGKALWASNTRGR